MSLVLNIDTAVQTASICLAEGEKILGLDINPTQKDHASWLHPAILRLLEQSGARLSQLSAVAVSSGPGSYTGLRVGMAAAKGLCYSLKIPMLTVSTLQMMAAAAGETGTEWRCPMIDARRMEVFAAIFDRELGEVMLPTNLVLDENSFAAYLDQQSIAFFGNGSVKLQPLIHHDHARFISVDAHAAHLVALSYKKLKNREFTDLAYAEPFYGKDFHSFIK